MDLRSIIKLREIRIDAEHLGIFDRFISSLLCLLFLFGLEKLNEVHGAALVCRRSHLSIELFLINSTGRSPR